MATKKTTKKTASKKKSTARSKAVAKTAKESTGMSLLDSVNAATGTAPGKASEKERYHLTGVEELATRIRSQKVELESLEAEHEKDKTELSDKCKEVRLGLEKDGDFHTTLLVDTNDHDEEGNMLPVMAVFQDKYSKKVATPELEKVLQSALGDHYDKLVTRKMSLGVKAGTTLKDLEEALGEEAYTKLLTLVTPKEEITLKKGFLETRFALRSTMSDELNEQIDGLAEGLRHKPLIRAK